MYKYYYCKHIKDNFYDIKININKLSHLIKKYDLEFNSSVKEYWLNNIKIVSDKNNVNFYKIYDKNIKYENEYLIQEYTSKVTESFNFNETHLEDEYILYDNTINNIKIILKNIQII